ncbi:alanine racemase [Mycobacterium sp. 852002-51057_SCH5723018]|uniref:alanine racemase n=1 Tax=Mycobacterium sp. 852002-51057_SCH5723018 TaxID=1834094 RepID=UPI0008020E23|nr:alanine racemase [Mycobacterium sp. 852002-51057_SCH5723018]OBG22421.1 alanine racemase [Mycobacterium sp. 852002-51057_SCH5723018]
MKGRTVTPISLTPGVLAEAVVDLGAIAHNVRVLREHAGRAQVMAVVKADGYGHGAAQVARAALAAGAAELGVATVDEALALRADGITAPVLAWLHPPGIDFGPALLADVELAVSSVRQLDEVLDAVRRTGRTATVTVKVDTGLNRNGVAPAHYPSMMTALRQAVADDAIRLRGLMSHMVHADQPESPINDLQAQRFSDALARARDEGLRFEVAHLANSSTTMSRPDLTLDLVRPGIAVYGLSPVPQRGDMGLIPAMTVKCAVALVKPVRAGEGVSYGHTWIAERDTNVALMPIGYADGVFRSLGGRLDVLINGRRRPGVGRICMDQFVVDLGPDPVDVAEGDEAVLFGPGTGGEPTAQDWADLLGTIHYEVVTSPRGRITRTYREAETVEP